MQSTENNRTKIKINDGFIFMAVIFFALFLRTYNLDNRPLHVDEAVHAVKFGELLEEGYYKYDPIEYHGPTLNYFTLLTTKFFGIDNFSDLNEKVIRLVPAIISVMFVFFIILILKQFDKKLVHIIVILLSISPIFIFYGRYYIQETLLVSFTYLFLILIFNHLKDGKTNSIVLAGIFAGLIFATKETSIIIFGTAVGTFILMILFDRSLKEKISVSFNHSILFVVSAMIVSVVFYSSFFSNWQGVLDSIKTFTNYFSKAASNSYHIHPWYYYIKLLLFSNNSLIIFSELFLFLFSVIGIVYSFTKKTSNQIFFRFISIFSLSQFLVYSIIPYKTPWLALNFWIGFIILAAFGIIQTYSLIKNQQLKIIFSVFILLGISWNLWQSYVVNFKYPFQPQNPFTYSQAEFDVVELSEIVTKIADKRKAGEKILINVTSPNDDYWPLPWYLRRFENIAWYSKVDTSIYHFPIIISVPEYEEEIVNILYTKPPPGKKNLYVPLFDHYLELRPGVELRGYVQKDVLDLYNRSLEE